MNTNKKLEKKQKLLETAFQLFRSAGVSSTAIDDVVKSAGIARGTFYLYFKDKSDLLEQLIMYKSTETMKEILVYARQAMTDEAAEFDVTVRRVLEMYVDFLVEHRDILMVLHKNFSACMRDFPRFYDDEADGMFEVVMQKFEAEGFSAEETPKTLFIVINMIDSVCSDAIMYGRPFPLEEIRDTVIDAAMAIFRNKMRKREGNAIHESCA